MNREGECRGIRGGLRFENRDLIRLERTALYGETSTRRLTTLSTPTTIGAAGRGETWAWRLATPDSARSSNSKKVSRQVGRAGTEFT